MFETEAGMSRAFAYFSGDLSLRCGVKLELWRSAVVKASLNWSESIPPKFSEG